MNLTLHQFDLPLRHEFTIARGSERVYRALIIELEQDGYRGYGEAGESTFYDATIENMTRALEQVRPAVESYELGDPTQLWQELDTSLSTASFAQCALDMGAHDLWGKLRGKPVWELWGLSLDRLPVSNYTIGIASIDTMVAKLNEFPDWPVYKIKLGTADDLAIVRELRRHTAATFRVDANCGWSVEQTLRNAESLKELGVEFIEQPLPRDDWEGMRRVHDQSVLPIIADESCQAEPDIDRCRGLFHGVNVKLVKCGGLTPARRMLDRAKELGLKTMVGCMTETTVGISAIGQLLPMLDYVDMDGALLLGQDIASGVTVKRGRVSYPNENGCGVRLLDQS